MIQLLFRTLALLPLPLLHSLGVLLGWAAYLVKSQYRERLAAHAALGGADSAQRAKSVGHAGRLVTELPHLWFGRRVSVEWRNAEIIESALDAGRGIVFLTPHLGSFEATARAYAERFGTRQPLTVLYRPQRKAVLRDLVDSARTRPGLATAPTTLGGVKTLLQTLRRGGCVGLLPDQVPPSGLGLWAPLWGKDAYTMTLAARLIAQTRPTVIWAWGERLSWGRGFVVHVTAGAMAYPEEPAACLAALNAELEALVAQAPEQYLWAYDRYKQPAKALTLESGGRS